MFWIVFIAYIGITLLLSELNGYLALLWLASPFIVVGLFIVYAIIEDAMNAARCRREGNCPTSSGSSSSGSYPSRRVRHDRELEEAHERFNRQVIGSHMSNRR